MDLMETVIAYFETIPTLHRSLILVGGLSFFWILEGPFSLFNFKYKKCEQEFWQNISLK